MLTSEPQGIYAYKNVGPDQCEKGIYSGTNKKSAGRRLEYDDRANISRYCCGFK